MIKVCILDRREKYCNGCYPLPMFTAGVFVPVTIVR